MATLIDRTLLYPFPLALVRFQWLFVYFCVLRLALHFYFQLHGRSISG
jgi:hypothetical protein